MTADDWKAEAYRQQRKRKRWGCRKRAVSIVIGAVVVVILIAQARTVEIIAAGETS